MPKTMHWLENLIADAFTASAPELAGLIEAAKAKGAPKAKVVAMVKRAAANSPIVRDSALAYVERLYGGDAA